MSTIRQSAVCTASKEHESYRIREILDRTSRLRFGIERRSQIGQPGEQRHGEDAGCALVAVRAEVDAGISLAQLGAVWVDEEGEMGERRRLPAEGFVEGEMFRRGDEPFLQSSATRSTMRAPNQALTSPRITCVIFIK